MISVPITLVINKITLIFLKDMDFVPYTTPQTLAVLFAPMPSPRIIEIPIPT
jgi:hypothetical protein